MQQLQFHWPFEKAAIFVHTNATLHKIDLQQYVLVYLLEIELAFSDCSVGTIKVIDSCFGPTTIFALALSLLLIYICLYKQL